MQWYESDCAAELSDSVLFNLHVRLEVEYRVVVVFNINVVICGVWYIVSNF